MATIHDRSEHFRTACVTAAAGAMVLACGCAKQRAESPPTPVPLAAATAAQEPTVIDLGTELFQPGERAFRPGAKESINQALAQVPPGSELRVDVFDQRRRHGGWTVDRNRMSLSSLRAIAMKTYLEGQGFTVTEAVGRGVVVVDGRPADRRVEVRVAGVK